MAKMSIEISGMKFLELICQYALWLSRPQVSGRKACHQRQIANGRTKGRGRGRHVGDKYLIRTVHCWCAIGIGARPDEGSSAARQWIYKHHRPRINIQTVNLGPQLRRKSYWDSYSPQSGQAGSGILDRIKECSLSLGHNDIVIDAGLWYMIEFCRSTYIYAICWIISLICGLFVVPLTGVKYGALAGSRSCFINLSSYYHWRIRHLGKFSFLAKKTNLISIDCKKRFTCKFHHLYGYQHEDIIFS